MAGAFDNVCPKAAIRVMRKRKIDGSILDWYSHYLLNGLCNITIKGITIEQALKKGTPQGGVLSVILWLLIFDELLNKFGKQKRIKIIGFADDELC